MSLAVTLILPNQLFNEHPAIHIERPVYLIEEWHYFNQYNFHQQKLVLHRASMKFYAEFLASQGLEVNYIEAIGRLNKCEALIKNLHANKVKQIQMVDPIDNWVTRKIKDTCKKYSIELIIYKNPNFLN